MVVFQCSKHATPLSNLYVSQLGLLRVAGNYIWVVLLKTPEIQTQYVSSPASGSEKQVDMSAVQGQINELISARSREAKQAHLAIENESLSVLLQTPTLQS